MKRLPDDRLRASAAWLEPSRLVWSSCCARRAARRSSAHGNDITTDAIVDARLRARAPSSPRASRGVIAGIEVALRRPFTCSNTRVSRRRRVDRRQPRGSAARRRRELAGPARRCSHRRTHRAQSCWGGSAASRPQRARMVDLVAGTRAHVVARARRRPVCARSRNTRCAAAAAAIIASVSTTRC